MLSGVLATAGPKAKEDFQIGCMSKGYKLVMPMTPIFINQLS
jgi:hypothetical protein